jgi:hypothetical protein
MPCRSAWSEKLVRLFSKIIVGVETDKREARSTPFLWQHKRLIRSIF